MHVQLATEPDHPREDTAAALRTWAMGMLLLAVGVAAVGWIEAASASDSGSASLTTTP